jgi:hypothetical protein
MIDPDDFRQARLTHQVERLQGALELLIGQASR